MGRLIRRLVLWLVVLPGILFFVLTDSEPVVTNTAQPTGADVRATRAVVHRIRAATSVNAPQGEVLRISEAELQSGLKASGRIIPGFRGTARVGGSVAVVRASVPLPEPLRRRWVNVEVAVPAFEDGLALQSVRIGKIGLPPAFALFAARIGLNAALGDAAGNKILAAASNMAVEGDQLAFTMDLTRQERGDIMASVFGVMRGGNVELGDQIDAVFVALRDAIEDERLPDRGSLHPHLVFVLNAVQAPDRAIAPEDRAAVALMALAKACGAWDFAFTVGGLSGKKPAELGQWSTGCQRVRLRGRVDSRLHFTTAAALRAASNRGFAVSIGEFKELSDSVSGGTGFDFSDLAANNSGIRVADHFSSLPPAAWSRAIGRLSGQGAFVAPLEGLPPRMTEAEFARRFGEIGSPAYDAILAEIEGRIDALSLYR